MKRCIRKSKGYKGIIRVAPDKSLSHRAALISSMASGKSRIQNFNFGRDCQATLNSLEKTGVDIRREDAGTLGVTGKGLFGFREPAEILHAENSGTTARMLLGLLAGQDFFSVIQGDRSLRQRPMKRVTEPLIQMGAHIAGRDDGNHLPLSIRGGQLQGITYALPVPSAQLKSALILAGLQADGETVIEESILSRDHTERLLRHFGAEVQKNKKKTHVFGKKEFQGREIFVPGDFSAASFFITATLLVKNSRVEIPEVGTNATRTGFLRAVKKMGALVETHEKNEAGGEPFATISARSSCLQGIEITAQEIPPMIDEVPLLVLLGTQAKGRTRIAGASELRMKECDRISAVGENLRRMGIELEEKPDGLIVEGPQELKGARVDSFGDHRIAMTLAVAGLVAQGETWIDGFECHRVSFPDFSGLLRNWQND